MARKKHKKNRKILVADNKKIISPLSYNYLSV